MGFYRTQCFEVGACYVASRLAEHPALRASAIPRLQCSEASPWAGHTHWLVSSPTWGSSGHSCCERQVQESEHSSSHFSRVTSKGLMLGHVSGTWSLWKETAKPAPMVAAPPTAGSGHCRCCISLSGPRSRRLMLRVLHLRRAGRGEYFTCYFAILPSLSMMCLRKPFAHF